MSSSCSTSQQSLATRLIESDAFAFEFVSELAQMESWRKEVYRPIYHIHKWWAKRLGSVFRAILLGSVLPESAKLSNEFYRKHDYRELTVFDPFIGSGTTIGEAHKLGFTALGRDINPVACEAVRVALGQMDRHALMKTFRQLSAGVGERIRELYRTTDASGQICDTLYYFWVKTLPCPSCSKVVDLFSSYIFARNAYPERKPLVRVYCPECSGVFSANVNDERVTCSNCQVTFDPRHAPANGASATCIACKATFPIAKAVKATGQPPSHRLFAKLVLTASGDKEYLPVSAADIKNYENCSHELTRSGISLPTLELEDGHNTRQVINYAYHAWRQFFNDRQLLALGWLREAIVQLPDAGVRDAMLIVFSGTLEFNNMFASYKGEGTGAVRHMFSHHILKPERVPIEGNVWGTSKSSGAFSTLFKSRLMRAIEYRLMPFEVGIEKGRTAKSGRRVFGASDAFAGCVKTDWPPHELGPRTIHLSCGPSAATGLPNASVDLIVTDPPFFNNVHYSELADFFFAWQQLTPTPFAKVRLSTRHVEEVQDVSAELFGTKLRTVLEECSRVLRDEGLLVLTYHHSHADGWLSLSDAVAGAGFAFVNCHPVKAEMSVAAPKSQAKEPIQLDVILACRKKPADKRCGKEAADALRSAIERAKAKAARLGTIGLKLSANDRRVLLIGQFLVEACPGRSATELTMTLAASFATLNFAASRLSEKADHFVPSSSSLEPQLILFAEPLKSG
jgi:putative DNA methylase